MSDKTDRRCFLARGVLGAAAIGAAHTSIEENTLSAAIQDGTAQPNRPVEPKTAAFMETVDKPWVAFKVMAAGAIPPRMAFSYAYRHGADFIIAGMFDFQVENDVKIAIEFLRKARNRKRPWHG